MISPNEVSARFRCSYFLALQAFFMFSSKIFFVIVFNVFYEIRINITSFFLEILRVETPRNAQGGRAMKMLVKHRHWFIIGILTKYE